MPDNLDLHYPLLAWIALFSALGSVGRSFHVWGKLGIAPTPVSLTGNVMTSAILGPAIFLFANMAVARPDWSPALIAGAILLGAADGDLLEKAIKLLEDRLDDLVDLTSRKRRIGDD